MKHFNSTLLHTFLVITLIGLNGCGSSEQETSSEAEASSETVATVELSEADLALATDQRVCPVGKGELGSMGTPIKVMVEGEPVFICCEHCREPLLADPDKYLPNIAEAKKDRGLPEDTSDAQTEDDASEPS